MRIGIGLPSAIADTSGDQLVEWAASAEEHGFSSLGVIDRLVFRNTEPLVTLAAAAAVTRRIKLMTSILLAPLRINAALLAKQAATVDHISGGRLVLGMAVGGYADDYHASGIPFAQRGRRFDEMLARMRQVWDGEPFGFAGPIGPVSTMDKSRIVFGGGGARTFARVAVHGGGWIAGSRGVAAFSRGVEGVRQAWAEHGRAGNPALLAQPYFCLGSGAQENAAAFLADHYAVEGTGPVPVSALTDAAAIRETIAEYERAGCDELMLLPCVSDLEQVRLLADAALRSGG